MPLLSDLLGIVVETLPLYVKVGGDSATGRNGTAVRDINGRWYCKTASLDYPLEVLSKDKATFDQNWAWACYVQDMNMAALGRKGISVSVQQTA